MAEVARAAHDVADLTRTYHEWFAAARVLIRQIQPELEAAVFSLYEGTEGAGGALEKDPQRMGIIGAFARFPWTPAHNTLVMKINAQAGMVAGLMGVLDIKALDLQSLVAYDLMTDELAAAEHLVETGYTRAAGAVTGVVLERHLKMMCNNRRVAMGERETLGSLNLKLKDSYQDPSDYRRVIWLSEVRAQCDHDKDKEPDAGTVKGFVHEVRKFISTVS